MRIILPTKFVKISDPLLNVTGAKLKIPTRIIPFLKKISYFNPTRREKILKKKEYHKDRNFISRKTAHGFFFLALEKVV